MYRTSTRHIVLGLKFRAYIRGSDFWSCTVWEHSGSWLLKRKGLELRIQAGGSCLQIERGCLDIRLGILKLGERGRFLDVLDGGLAQGIGRKVQGLMQS